MRAGKQSVDVRRGSTLQLPDDLGGDRRQTIDRKKTSKINLEKLVNLGKSKKKDNKRYGLKSKSIANNHKYIDQGFVND